MSKLVFLAGAVAGAAFASTPQGKSVVDNVSAQVKRLWERPQVQKVVRNASGEVRKRVPVVGDDIADTIDAAPKPTPTTSSPATS